MFRDLAIVIVTATVVAGGFYLMGNREEPGPEAMNEVAAPDAAIAVPRTAAGRPDFSGIWQTNSTANWDLQTHDARPMVAQPGVYEDVPVLAAPVVALGTVGWVPPGMGVVVGGGIPYRPWAAERKRENQANWLDRDPELGCYMPGVPRAMYLPYPFQIIQGTNKIMMVFEFANAQRTINLDDVAPYPGEAFMGYSVGRWDGDTLVVDVTDFSPYTWFDRAGNFHSDALHVIERYTLIGPNVIQYEATIEDEKVFTRPWTIRVPLYRRLEPDAQVLDFKCIEEVEETIYGHLRKEPLVERWEGETMIIDITRKVPPEEVLYELLWSGNPPEEQ
jgi:hypothetical protein